VKRYPIPHILSCQQCGWGERPRSWVQAISPLGHRDQGEDLRASRFCDGLAAWSCIRHATTHATVTSKESYQESFSLHRQHVRLAKRLFTSQRVGRKLKPCRPSSLVSALRSSELLTVPTPISFSGGLLRVRSASVQSYIRSHWIIHCYTQLLVEESIYTSLIGQSAPHNPLPKEAPKEAAAEGDTGLHMCRKPCDMKR
jgi:hypothetical protein